MSLDVYLKHSPDDEDGVFSLNITHNLTEMAEEAEIYRHLWHPEDLGITKVAELIEPFTSALKLMISDPERFKRFNLSNGWGDYDGLVKFVKKYLIECICYPDAIIEVSR